MIGLLTAVVPGWAKWAAIALTALALVAFGYVRGIDHAEDRHAVFVAGVAKAGAEQAARTGATIRKQRQLTEDTRNGYAQGLDALHRYYAGRLRQQPGPGGCAMPAVPGAAAGTDARPADAGSGAGEHQAAGDDLMERCAQTTLQFLTLRQWVAGQSAVWR